MTKAKLTGWLAVFILALAAALPGRAAEDTHQPYIVLVGISKYADEQILPKPHAEADAKALYDLFTNKDYLGVDSSHIKLLLGTTDATRQGELATHENVLQALRWAANKAGRDQLVIFAFFGQGAPLSERSCYFATDSTFKDRAKNAIGASEIEHVLEKLKSQRFCVFLDVNFKGFNAGKDPAPDPNLQNFYKEYLGTNEDTPPPGRIVFLANRGLTPSLHVDKHGLFAKVLLDGLKGAADKEGYEPDGVVTIDELITYLDKEIPAQTSKLGKTKEEKDEIHHVLGGRSSHFVITKNPAVTAKVEARLKKFDEISKEAKLSSELIEEGHTLLSRMPKLEAQRNIRKDYQKLVDGDLTVEEFTKDRTKILAGLKLRRSAALGFAAKVIQATEVMVKDYVKDLNQGELVGWAIRGLYQRLDEKVPQDIKERLDKVKDLKEADLTVLLADVRERLGNREDLANHKDLDYSLQRMLHHLDPYTTYIDPETRSAFETETRGNFSGIGVQIRKDTARDMLVVVTPIINSPAYNAKPLNEEAKKVGGKGLKAGDVITTVTREVDSFGKPLNPPEVISTKGWALNEAVKKIKGQKGTKVKLTVEREGVEKPLEFEITRGNVEVESVLGIQRKPDDSWDYLVDPENKIAYVRLTSFSRNTYRDLDRVVRQLEKKGMKGFILDLRFNPGGLLSSAVDISDLFIDDGLIVTIKPRVGKDHSYSGEHEGSLLDFPMVCLVNGGSASGSEIVSACLQDHKRAIVMGERSYGKGSVQNIQDFEEGQLKLTVASFWRPNGKNLNKSSTGGKDDEEWGVTPDKGYLLKLPLKERDELAEHMHNTELIPRRDLPVKEDLQTKFIDRQLEMALDYLRGQIRTASNVPDKKAG